MIEITNCYIFMNKKSRNIKFKLFVYEYLSLLDLTYLFSYNLSIHILISCRLFKQ